MVSPHTMSSHEGPAALKAAIAAPKNRMCPHVAERGWQPIETAPRDGTPILAYDEFGRTMAVHLKQCEVFAQWVACGKWMEEMSRPTHWMPLPEPPGE